MRSREKEERQVIPGNVEEGTHGVQMGERRLAFSQFDRCDPQ